MALDEMVDVSLTHKEVATLLASLKTAEQTFTTLGEYSICKNLTKLYDSIWKQIFTYGQVTEEELNG